MSDAPAPTSPPPDRRWLRLLPIAVIAALFVALIASGELKQLSLASLAEHRAALLQFVRAHPYASLAAYLGVYILVIVACAPGPAVLSMAGGFLFGPVLGGAMALASMGIGAVMVFMACRTAFGDWAAHRAGAVVARIEAGFSRDAFAYLLALRLMPVAPFFAVNLAAGLARIRLATFVMATLVGAAPSAFIFATLGHGLGAMFRRHAHLGANLLLQPQIAGPLMALTGLSLAAPAWRVWRSRRAKATAPGSVAGDGGL
ncbi:MAG TPA: TVP38/TMEM64 family protein [Caulobacteraceae bacterium]|nr:TVP38/TMEM64 family protein [Caulobacteraceae bacterium]